ncbi:GFA family protein [Phenylobacterium sp.]|uniref:GFA family protein n=1 Tax=Phenylobacterium sp. TaxID=1871053 RepID=UPI0025F78427|nr:GFA family protein [Phenylobacterium sp.]
MAASVLLIGGCGCGAVRYEISAAPIDPGYCHCETCRRVSGAPVLAYASVPTAAFRVTRGALRIWRSSSFGRRGFCEACGAHLTMQVDEEPDVIDVTLASLDDPSAVVPQFHIWTRSQIPWFEIADEKPRYATNRAGTAGTAGG